MDRSSSGTWSSGRSSSAACQTWTPRPFSEIRGRVSGYDDEASEEALEKRFDRDKKDLRKLGVPIEYVAEVGPSSRELPLRAVFSVEVD